MTWALEDGVPEDLSDHNWSPILQGECGWQDNGEGTMSSHSATRRGSQSLGTVDEDRRKPRLIRRMK